MEIRKKASQQLIFGGIELAEHSTQGFEQRIHRIFSRWIKEKATEKKISTRKIAKDICLIGIGSVARREMLRLSDADILILYEAGKKENKLVVKLIRNLRKRIIKESECYEISIPPVYTIEKCIKITKNNDFFNAEIKIVSLLAGSKKLFKKFKQDLKPFLFNLRDDKVLCNILLDLWAWKEDYKFVEEKDNEPNVKRGKGALRNILAVAIVSKTIYKINGNLCIEILQNLAKDKRFKDLRFRILHLISALDFYLFLRNCLHSYYWDLKQIPQKRNELNVLNKQMRNKIFAGYRLLFNNETTILKRYFCYSRFVNDLVNQFEKRFISDLKKERGKEWGRKFNETRKLKCSIREQLRMAEDKDFLIRFSLGWYAKEEKVLKQVYIHSKNKAGYWNILYALSRNENTSFFMLRKLGKMEDYKNKSIGQRAREILKLKYNIK